MGASPHSVSSPFIVCLISGSNFLSIAQSKETTRLAKGSNNYSIEEIIFDSECFLVLLLVTTLVRRSDSTSPGLASTQRCWPIQPSLVSLSSSMDVSHYRLTVLRKFQSPLPSHSTPELKFFTGPLISVSGQVHLKQDKAGGPWFFFSSHLTQKNDVKMLSLSLTNIFQSCWVSPIQQNLFLVSVH